LLSNLTFYIPESAFHKERDYRPLEFISDAIAFQIQNSDSKKSKDCSIDESLGRFKEDEPILALVKKLSDEHEALKMEKTKQRVKRVEVKKLVKDNEPEDVDLGLMGLFDDGNV